jgi:cytoskeletal protein CcmA (bactofilin family)
MVFKRRSTDRLKPEETTVITTGIQLRGTVEGTSDVILHGSLEENIRLSGTMVLAKNGKIRGEINATNLVIEGDVEGIIRAAEKVEIRDGGRCKGDIFTATIAISEKAYFEGNMKMEVRDKVPRVLTFAERRRSQSETEGTPP